MKTTARSRREAAQLFRLCLINGLLDQDRARLIVQLIVAMRPRGAMATLANFRRLIALDHARHTAKVESAVPLPADLQSRVQLGLARVYGAGLSVMFTNNPALTGGLRIQVGSDVYDGSVRARLAALAGRFS
jgi:F-type H+-transporting ATPase subunit delta